MIDYTNYQGCETYEEALKFLDEHNTSSVIPFEVKIFCATALEKQIPKKPILKGMHYECECGNWLLYTDEIPQDSDSFCFRCGNAIDWSEANENL